MGLFNNSFVEHFVFEVEIRILKDICFNQFESFDVSKFSWRVQRFSADEALGVSAAYETGGDDDGDIVDQSLTQPC